MKAQIYQVKIQLEALAKTGNIAKNLWEKTGLKKKVFALIADLKQRFKKKDYILGEQSHRYVDKWRSELQGKYDIWKYVDHPELKTILKQLGTKFVTGVYGTHMTTSSDIGYQPQAQVIQWLFGAGIIYKAIIGEFRNDKETTKRLFRDLEHVPDVIEHEVSHLMRDAEHGNISKFVRKMTAGTPEAEKLIAAYSQKHADFPFEIDAIVSAISSLKKRFGEAKWNRITFNAVELALGRAKGHHFTPSQRKMMLKRLNREGLLGKNMRKGI